MPGGEAVAGMTKEQVRLAMDGNPTTYRRINGQEVWIYANRGPSLSKSVNDFSTAPDSTSERNRNFTETDEFAATHTRRRFMIYFQGDRAVRCQITEERP